jgi:hypothetical protein
VRDIRDAVIGEQVGGGDSSIGKGRVTRAAMIGQRRVPINSATESSHNDSIVFRTIS